MTNKNFYKEMKDLASYVQDSENFPKPAGWHIIKNYENKQNGFRATAFKNDSGKKVLVYAGTDLNKEILKDFLEDVKMSQKIIPNQANDAFNAYENFKNNFLNRYSSNSITIVGYSLGGSLAQIICNETGAEGVTFEAYGVGDLVNAKHTEQIVNFGNENDPIFLKNIDNHLGTINVILKNNSRDSVYSENKFSIENINHLNLSNHNLENIRDYLRFNLEKLYPSRELNPLLILMS